MQINMKRKYDDIADSCRARMSKSSLSSSSSKVFPLLSALFWPEPFVSSFSGVDSHLPPSSFPPSFLFFPSYNSCIFPTWLSHLLLSFGFPLPFTLLSTSPLWTLLSVCPPPFPPFPPTPLPLFLRQFLQPPGVVGPLWLSASIQKCS